MCGGGPGAGHHATDDPVAFDGPLVDHAVEVAPRIWWVGNVMLDDPFQSHPYLIEAGERSVIVDPGSELTIDVTLDKVREVVELDQIATILLHHSDPDCADAVHRLGSILRDDAEIVTEWRSELLLRHLAPRFATRTIEDLGWELELEPGRTLQFLLTPYLHFPGAFVTHETSTRSLFTADLFGGFNRGRRLRATSADDFEDLRTFHEHYMPSREILMAGLAMIRARFGSPDRLLPQHGYVVPSDLVDGMFEALYQLDCGVMLHSRSDAHLARLIDAAAAARRMENELRDAIGLVELLAVSCDILGSVFPVSAVAVERREIDGTTLRYDQSHPDGNVIPWLTARSPTQWILELTDAELTQQVVVEIADGGGPVEREILELFTRLLPSVRTVVERMLDLHLAQREREAWRQSASVDPLTGLENRQLLDIRSSLDHSTAVLMIDLDEFKQINDGWGHPIGDEVLRRAAAAIRSVLRPHDRAFRYGGEEFVVLAPMQPGDATLAERLGERLRRAVERVETADLTPGRGITTSVGAATGPPDTPLIRMIERADLALYRAKRLGKNRVEVAGA
jgi:two-component system, cell cycle response regulator